MYLLTHRFFITINQLVFLLFISYCNRCRTVSLQSALLSLISSLMVRLVIPHQEQFESRHDDMPPLRALYNEAFRWCIIFGPGSLTAELPNTLMKSLVSVDLNSFLNLWILMVLVCTLPVTSVEADRSFSVFRLIKSDLISHIAETTLFAFNFNQIHYMSTSISKHLQIGSLKNSVDVC